MAGRTTTRPVVGFAATVFRLGLVGAFTAIETVALAAWLEIVRGTPAASRTAAIGLGVLAVGLFAEHVLTDLAVNGLDFSLPVGSVAVFTLTETALWGGWLVIAEQVGGLRGIAVAGVVLAALLVPQHTVEDSVLRGAPLLSRLLDRRTLGFSVVEAAGATAWLALVIRGDLVEPALAGTPLAGVDPALLGLGVLAVALFVEHTIGVRFSRRPERVSG